MIFGSGDSSAFRYDLNTGRMTNYTDTVSTNLTTTGYNSGALTWNANGTLQQLAITDTLNSNDTQTCNYVYDDLVRITSANCGNSIWNQAFSYSGDTAYAFGNVTKSGSGAFGATYSASTNRLVSIGSLAPAYDYNGNLTSDGTGTHSYSWDADGNAISIVTTGISTVSPITYDAFDRIVEEYNGTSYGQVVYDTSGAKLALMNGQTLTEAFVPLPAGATAVYTASGLHHYRFPDWLGSSRVSALASGSNRLYYDGAYAPYGEAYAATGTTDLSFTGQNQDTVSNLYDFPAREYAYGQGRWIRPDPAGRAAGNLMNPQSLNRDAYVMNNPTTLVDPLGLTAQTCTPPKGYTVADTNPCTYKPVHTCQGMVCADQYYGGSIFEGFTGVSSGMGICFSSGVAGYCNQGALSGWSLGGYDEFDINLPSSGVYWTAAPGSAVINQSGRTSTNTGTLGFSDTLWSEATGTSNVLEFTGSTDPKVQFGKLQQIQDLLTGNYVFAPSTPSASSHMFNARISTAADHDSHFIQALLAKAPMRPRSLVKWIKGMIAKGNCMLRMTWLRMSSW